VIALKRLMFGLAALLVLALLGAVLLLATETGSRWLLAQVPGLQVQDFNGRLLKSWQAARLIWQENGQRVALSDVQMAINPACLLHLTLCVEQIKVGRADLHLPPASKGEADTAPLKLLPLRLPLLALELSQVQLGSLYLDTDEWLTEVNLQAHWRGHNVVIEQARARQQGRLVSLSGELQMQQNWPLNAAAQLFLPAPDGEDWQLKLTASGNLLETLAVQGQSQGWLNAQIDGNVTPLAQHLPLNLELDSEQPPFWGLPDNLQLSQLQVNASGDGQTGYQIKARANLADTADSQPPLTVHLQALAFPKQVEIKQLQLVASDTRSLTASGVIRLQPGLTAQLDLHGRDFPWQRLYPLEQLPLALRQINAKVQYENGQYLGSFATELGGAGANLSLSGPFAGDLTQLTLDDLQVKTDAGGAQGKLHVQFADAMAWQLALTLHQFNPAFWLDELPGQLSGSLSSQGKWQGAALQGDLAFDLNGKLRGQPAHLLAEGQGSQADWSLKRLNMRLGNNRLNGTASGAGEQLQADLTLTLAQLKQLWPELSGSANGRIQLHGTLIRPQGTVQLTAQKLILAEQSIGALKIDGQFLEDNGTLQLLATDIDALGQRFSRLALNASQKGAEQQLIGELRGELVKAAFALNGQYQVLGSDWQWLGDLRRFEFSGYGQDWQLSKPARLEKQADGPLSLAAHCLQSAVASLCTDNLKLLPQVRVNYRLQDFELASLAFWLPDNLRLAGPVFGEVALDLSTELNGSLRLASESGTLRVQQEEKWLDLPWQRFTLNGQMNKTAIDGALDFQSKVLGSFTSALQLNPNLADKPIHGQWQLDGLELALLLPFLPQLSDLGGQLSGQGRVQGALLAPQIEADMALKQGQISSPDLPLKLHQLELAARMRGEQMQLTGGFASGEQGRGVLNGQLSWQQGLSGKLHLSGEKLPVSLPPYAQLQVFPDLTLHLAEDKLSIDGRIQVPSGAIEIHSLPPSVVRPSMDASVVGREVGPRAQHSIGMNIALQVGSERVSFNGFGLQATLAGALHIGDNLSAQGELNLRGGRYRSYGQNLKVRRARLLFTGSLQQPFIDIEAVRETGRVVAGLRISGSADRPQTRIFAEPSMNDDQALSYLVLGKPLGSNSEGSNELLLKAALGLGLSGGEALVERFGEKIGLSNFELGTRGSGENTRVMVSGTLANRLSLSYGVGLFDPQGTFSLRYQLTRSLYLEAASSLANSLDLLYRLNF